MRNFEVRYWTPVDNPNEGDYRAVRLFAHDARDAERRAVHEIGKHIRVQKVEEL